MLWEHFQILTYDLRGHGYTPRTEVGYTPTQLATDLKQLLDELDIEKTDVIGHSYGADIALYFAYLYPERTNRAILIEPTVPAVIPILTRADLRHADWAARLLVRLGVPVPKEKRLDAEFLLEKALTLPMKWGPLKDMPATEAEIESTKDLLLGTSITKDMIDVGNLTLEHLAEIRVPIHLIYDSSSLWWHRSIQVLSERLPDVSTHVIETGSGDLSHWVPLERPELLAREIREVLLTESASV